MVEPVETTENGRVVEPVETTENGRVVEPVETTRARNYRPAIITQGRNCPPTRFHHHDDDANSRPIRRISVNR